MQTSLKPPSPSDDHANAHVGEAMDGQGLTPPPEPPAPGTVRLAIWSPSGLQRTDDLDALAPVLAAADTWVWVDATAPTVEEVERVGRALGLHPLVAEDIIEGNQRPKVEVTDATVHIVMFAIRYGAELEASEVDFVLGDRYLLTVHEPAWDPLATHQLRSALGNAFTRGPDHLLWALVDGIVDGYFPCLDRIGDEIDQLQDDVIEETTKTALHRLFTLKRDLLAMRRAISPVREIFNQLTNRDLRLIDDDEIIYFRDVYDHLIRITDELDTHRELVSGTLEVYLTTVNNNLSLIMKRLTGVTVILAGIGAVAGVFGMSEAASAINGGEGSGFWVITAVMAVFAGIAALFLRRIGWI
jgi:magnesium transporter